MLTGAVVVAFVVVVMVGKLLDVPISNHDHGVSSPVSCSDLGSLTCVIHLPTLQIMRCFPHCCPDHAPRRYAAAPSTSWSPFRATSSGSERRSWWSALALSLQAVLAN